MKPFIRKGKSKSGATTIQIEYREGRKRQKIVHIGSAHNELELRLLEIQANEIINANQLSFDFDTTDEELDIIQEKAYSETLWRALEYVYTRIGFTQVNDEVFKQLVLSRIVEPTSKVDAIRVLDELGLDTPSHSGILRSMKRCTEDDYRSILSKACMSNTTKSSLSLVLYDVTSLYFEIQKEDEYRKAGLSKERRLEPQIVIGLLVDRKGFPLEIKSFEGNKAEVKTIIPVLESFKGRYGVTGITVTADAAMLSAANIEALEKMGYNYIIASKMNRFPMEIDEYLRLPESELTDQQIFEAKSTVTIEGKQVKRRCIYQYREKRASLDIRNIEKSVAKAQHMIDNTKDYKRNQYLKVTGGTKVVDEDLVAKHIKRAGIKGYLTNLRIPAQEVIAGYHQLYEVEMSFRMSKSDLKARPIFHHTREAIEAHLTIVFAALAISRFIQRKTNISIRRFLRTLVPIRTGIVSLNGKNYIIKPRISPEATVILDLLTKN